MREAWLYIVAGVLCALLLGALLWMMHAASRNATTPVATSPAPAVDTAPTTAMPKVEKVGVSTEGRAIELYRFGTGSTAVLFVGGIHGGYEWNSVALAYEAIDHLKACPTCVPDELSVLIVPVLNPDGMALVLGDSTREALAYAPSDRDAAAPGRFNAREVDLNRNFDCKWQPSATWRGQAVSAGTAAFSEVEAQVLRDVVLREQPRAVVFWHSKAGAVYASECEEGVLPETLAITRAYATAANYRAVEQFDAYPVTGDAEGWLASIGIPAITVELETHDSAEWERNRRGVEALLQYYAQ